MDIKSGFNSLLKTDRRLSDLVRLSSLPPTSRDVLEVLAGSGDPRFMWPTLALMWFFANITWKQWAVIAAIGLVLLGMFTWPLKHLVRRQRPMGLWDHKTRDKDPHSFPSGHAARSFLLATLATALGPAWLAAFLCIWAPLVSLARVAMGVHYLFDIIGGFVLAIIVGLLWLYIHEGVLQALLTFSLRVMHLPLW